MNTLVRTLSAGLCLAALVGCSSAPSNTSPSPAASATTSTSASPSEAASVAPAATPSGGLTPETNAKEETVSNPKVGFKVTVPAGWQTVKQENMLLMSTKDEACMIMFLTQSDKNDHDVTKDLDKLLGNMMTDVKEQGSKKDVDFNGMKGNSSEGTGTMNGKGMAWMMNVIQAKQPFVMVVVFDPGRVEPHKADMSKIGPSLQPIKD